MRPGVRQDIKPVARQSEASPKVAIIILNWNGGRDTLACLESVRRLVYPNFQVVVVDNGSTDGSVDEIRGWMSREASAKMSLSEPAARLRPQEARFVLVENKMNLGFSEGVNVGIRHVLAAPSPPDFVFLLNNDARVEASAVSHCVEVSLKEGAAIVGAVIRSSDGTAVLFAGARFPRELFVGGRVALETTLRDLDAWESARAEASAMLIRRDVIERRLRECGHVLNPALFMYLEEIDLCRWTHERGLPTMIAGEAIAYHQLGRSGGALRHYYLTRNRILLARRLLPFPQRVVFFAWFFPFRMGQAMLRLLGGKSAAARATMAGLRDGYRSITGKWVRHPLNGGTRR